MLVIGRGIEVRYTHRALGVTIHDSSALRERCEDFDASSCLAGPSATEAGSLWESGILNCEHGDFSSACILS